MIVNYKENGWEIITQRAHGLLAFQLALQWRKSYQGPRWPELLVAIADHDDAQIELQQEALLSGQGGPLDFKMKPFELGHAQRTMEFAISKSRFIALMCSMHLDFVAGESGEKSPDVHHFLKAQKLLRTGWRKELKIKEVEATAHYRLMEWCDALSLLICRHENQPQQRFIQISRGPDNQPYQLVQPEHDVLSVQPWPFEDNAFVISFEIGIVQQLSFNNAEQFKKALLNSPVKEKTLLFKKV